MGRHRTCCLFLVQSPIVTFCVTLDQSKETWNCGNTSKRSQCDSRLGNSCFLAAMVFCSDLESFVVGQPSKEEREEHEATLAQNTSR